MTVFNRCLCSFFCFFVSCALASAEEVESSDVMSSEIESSEIEMDFAEVVRQRLYPGGADEQPLEVQAKLAHPVRMVDLKSVQKEILEEVMQETSEEQESEDEPAATDQINGEQASDRSNANVSGSKDLANQKSTKTK